MDSTDSSNMCTQPQGLARFRDIAADGYRESKGSVNYVHAITGIRKYLKYVEVKVEVDVDVEVHVEVKVNVQI